MRRSKSSTSVSSTDAYFPMPALLTRTSIGPRAAVSVSRADSTDARSATSATAVAPVPPMAPNTFSRSAADHAHVGDRWVRHERVLDFRGVDVLAARHDHVFYAVMDVEVAVGVEIAGVAGTEPAAVEECLVGGLGHLPVALHVLMAAGHDL